MFRPSEVGALVAAVCFLIGIPTMIWGDITTGFYFTAAGFGLGIGLK